MLPELWKMYFEDEPTFQAELEDKEVEAQVLLELEQEGDE